MTRRLVTGALVGCVAAMFSAGAAAEPRQIRKDVPVTVHGQLRIALHPTTEHRP